MLDRSDKPGAGDDVAAIVARCFAALDKLTDGDRAALVDVIAGVVDRVPGLALEVLKEERRRALVEMAGLYDGSRSARAKAIADDLDRYVSGAWPRDRDGGLRPNASERRRLLYRITRANRGGSFSWRSIIDIFAKQPLVSANGLGAGCIHGSER